LKTVKGGKAYKKVYAYVKVETDVEVWTSFKVKAVKAHKTVKSVFEDFIINYVKDV
jgi:hypothetical protein